MSKQKKKRSKAYKGADAASARPSITRIHAVKRSPVGEWWHNNRRIAKPVLIGTSVTSVIILCLIGLFL